MAGVRGLVPRGTLFERYMTCPVEPTRNGLYQCLGFVQTDVTKEEIG